MPKVELLGTFGNDLMVANAARISYDRWHDRLNDADLRLIARLARHGHNSPFYHPKLQFRITAPFYVAAQLKRHHVGFDINEVSRRYTKADPEMELPQVWRRASEHGNPQVSGDAFAPDEQAVIVSLVSRQVGQAQGVYDGLIGRGVAPEQARVVLPVATLTTWLWTGSLFGYAKLCRERLAVDAQPETAAVAAEIDRVGRVAFPASWTALVHHPQDTETCAVSVRVPHQWELQPDDTLRCYDCREVRGD